MARPKHGPSFFSLIYCNCDSIHLSIGLLNEWQYEVVLRTIERTFTYDCQSTEISTLPHYDEATRSQSFQRKPGDVALFAQKPPDFGMQS